MLFLIMRLSISVELTAIIPKSNRFNRRADEDIIKRHSTPVTIRGRTGVIIFVNFIIKVSVGERDM